MSQLPNKEALFWRAHFRFSIHRFIVSLPYLFTMSLFYWNSYVERRNAAAMVNAMNNALLMDYESKSSSSSSISSLSSSGSMTDDDMSIASAGDSSNASYTTNSSNESSSVLSDTSMFRTTTNYLRTVYGPYYDDSIEWGKRMLIRDISKSDAMFNF